MNEVEEDTCFYCGRYIDPTFNMMLCSDCEEHEDDIIEKYTDKDPGNWVRFDNA